MEKLFLKPGKEKSLQRYHPWIFSGALTAEVTSIPEGDVIEIYSSDNQFMAVGYVQHDSIAVKILSFEKTECDRNFWKERFMAAIHYRKQMGFFDNPNTNVFRLINGEGDFLPGLIIDWYNGTAVIQCHSRGMFQRKKLFCELLQELLPQDLQSVFCKSSGTLPYNMRKSVQDDFLWGKAEETCIVSENGNKYSINFREAQKTGFFIDQRENRALVSRLSKNKTVLNTFGYTGGFSVSALQGGAKYVKTLDISQKAIDGCNENVKLNFSEKVPHEALAVDVLDYLNREEEKYDIIILDPPAFAKHLKDLQQGIKAYRSINKRALENLNPGGFLFTFSCSQVVSKQDFITMLFSAAALAKKKVRIVEHCSHAADHPVSIFHPEGSYLKGLLVYVE